MRGLWEHFKLTLRLNFRSRQALIYGYLVPVFFLIAFGSIYRGANPPLLRQLGQLLTISVLGGACFGMPTAMVAERERGVWRRYRLLPAATGSLVISMMAARFVIVLSAAVMQVALAALMYGMPMPAHPVGLGIAFVVVTFAFLGMGLVIAMLADAVPAVQALGQALFLPMIIIGGVGVPLWMLPGWAQHVAGFLPGKYAVEALQACAVGEGLRVTGFDLAALAAIGAAGCIAGGKMFRWDAHEKGDPGRWGWAGLAVGVWLSVGIVAELSKQNSAVASATEPATVVTTMAADASQEGGVAQSGPAMEVGLDSGYQSLTPAQMAVVKYEDLPDDLGTVTPVAHDLDQLDEKGKLRVSDFRRRLAGWGPGHEGGIVRRVRNLLEAAGVADIVMDEYEGALALVVFERLRAEIPDAELRKALAWVALHPADDRPLTKVEELGIEGSAMPRDLEERAGIYATKLLGRLNGRIKAQ